MGARVSDSPAGRSLQGPGGGAECPQGEQRRGNLGPGRESAAELAAAVPSPGELDTETLLMGCAHRHGRTRLVTAVTRTAAEQRTPTLAARLIWQGNM